MSVEAWLVISVVCLFVGAWLQTILIDRLAQRVERIERALLGGETDGDELRRKLRREARR